MAALFGAKEQSAKVVVVNRNPSGGASFYAHLTSMVDPLEPEHFTWTEFRYAERRENRHPDDNYLLLKCPVEIYTALQPDMRGTAVWKGKDLLSFTPETE